MINSEKEKYANGSSMDINTMSKEEKLQAIEYWCEGNQQLKKFLLYCNENDIETVGCCSGHTRTSEHLEENAYVAIKLGTEKDSYLINLLAVLEDKNRKMQIGFIRGCTGNYFSVLCATEIGNNEKFFEIINQECVQTNQNNFSVEKLRRKYEMLRNLLLDDRAKLYGNSSQYSFFMGEKQVRAVGFFDYTGKIVNIPNCEIERMGETLVNTPGEEMPTDFYGDKIKKIEYSISSVKEKARESKQPLNLIKRAFEAIKNIVSKYNDKTKEQEESER